MIQILIIARGSKWGQNGNFNYVQEIPKLLLSAFLLTMSTLEAGYNIFPEETCCCWAAVNQRTAQQWTRVNVHTKNVRLHTAESTSHMVALQMGY